MFATSVLITVAELRAAAAARLTSSVSTSKRVIVVLLSCTGRVPVGAMRLCRAGTCSPGPR